jgi:hypothetical protein
MTSCPSTSPVYLQHIPMPYNVISSRTSPEAAPAAGPSSRLPPPVVGAPGLTPATARGRCTRTGSPLPPPMAGALGRRMYFPVAGGPARPLPPKVLRKKHRAARPQEANCRSCSPLASAPSSVSSIGRPCLLMFVALLAIRHSPSSLEGTPYPCTIDLNVLHPFTICCCPCTIDLNVLLHRSG